MRSPTCLSRDHLQLSTVTTVAQPTSPPATHTEADDMAALHSTEVDDTTETKQHAMLSKHDGDSSSTGHHHNHRRHRVTTTTVVVAVDAANNGGGRLYREKPSRSPRRHSLQRVSRGRAPSLASPRRAATKDSVTGQHSHPARNSSSHEKNEWGHCSKRVDRPHTDVPDTNRPNNDASTQPNFRGNSSFHGQQRHPLLPFTTSTSNSSSATNTNTNTANAPSPARNPHHVKAAGMNLAVSHASLSHGGYQFSFPSFTVKGVKSGVPPPPLSKQPQRQQIMNSAYDLDPHAPSTPLMSSSVPTDIRARAQQPPETLHAPSAFPYRRHGQGVAGESPGLQRISHTRRPWQSMGEWNSTGRVHDDGHPRQPGASRAAEEEVNLATTKRHDGQRRRGSAAVLSDTSCDAQNIEGTAFLLTAEPSVAAVNAILPDTAHIRDYRFPSIFGQLSKASSPPQSFLLAPGVQPSLQEPELTSAAPSVMWRSAFGSFSTARLDEEGGGDRRTEKEARDFIAAPRSLYGSVVAGGSRTEMGSFFSPMNIPPPALSSNSGAEEEETKNPPHRRGPPARGAVDVKSLHVEAPLSDEDDEGSHESKTRTLALAAHPSDATQRGHHNASEPRISQGGSRHCRPLPKTLVKTSSLFIASGSSFHQPGRTTSKCESDFWDVPQEADSDEEASESGSIGAVVDAKERRSQRSELARKVTMYGRNWLEETGRGGVKGSAGQTGNSIIYSNNEDGTPAALHANSHETPLCHHRHRHHHSDEGDNISPSSASFYRGNSSDSDNSSDDGHTNTDGRHTCQPPWQQDVAALPQQEERESVVDVAVLQRILSATVDCNGGLEEEEEEEYVRAYPTAPVPPLHPPRPERPAYAPPTVAAAPLRTPYFGRVGNASPFRYATAAQQQQRQHHRRSTPTRCVAGNGFTQPGRNAGGRITGTHAAVYVRMFARGQGCHTSINGRCTSSPSSAGSPNGHAVPFRQTATGRPRVHQLLGLNPRADIRWVRSPDWRRMPPK